MNSINLCGDVVLCGVGKCGALTNKTSVVLLFLCFLWLFCFFGGLCFTFFIDFCFWSERPKAERGKTKRGWQTKLFPPCEVTGWTECCGVVVCFAPQDGPTREALLRGWVGGWVGCA